MMITPPDSSRSSKSQQRTTPYSSRSTLLPLMPEYSLRTPSFNQRPDPGASVIPDKKP